MAYNTLRHSFCGAAFAVGLLLATPGVVVAFSPTGACCQPNGQCAEVFDTVCEEGGGSFLGIGISCDAAQCDAHVSVPVLSILGLVGMIGGLTGLGLYRLIRARQTEVS